MTAPVPPVPSLPQRLAEVIAVWRGLVFHCHHGGDPAVQLLLFVVHRWLGRITRRFERLVARARAGTLADAPVRRRAAPPEPPAEPPAEAGARPEAAARCSGRVRLPGQPGWLLRLVPGLRGRAGHIEVLLADPEFLALLEQAPRAFARVLRPLCRAIGAIPPTLAGRRLRLLMPYDPPPEPGAEPAPAPGTEAGAAPRRLRARRRSGEADLIASAGRLLTPAQYRRSLGLPSRRPA